MYVCLCRAVGSKVVEDAILSGARSVEEVAEHCGATTVCGRCCRTVEKILNANLGPAPEPNR
jgi:bacterioferritin-associated ferredoxin